jgi:hypothetical protein
MPSPQKPRERSNWRRPRAAGCSCDSIGGQRPADRQQPDVGGAVAQPAPQDRRDDERQQGGEGDQRVAPAHERDEAERQRHQQQLAGAEARLDERERQPAPLCEPVGDGDRRGHARRAAEAQRGDDPVGQRELPHALGQRAQRQADGDQQRGDRQRPADAEAVDRPAHERLRAAVDEERQRADERDRAARGAVGVLPRVDERPEAQPHALGEEDRAEAQREDLPGVVAAHRPHATVRRP